MYVEVLFVTIINDFTVGNPSPPSTEGGQAAPAGELKWKTQKSNWILPKVPALAVTVDNELARVVAERTQHTKGKEREKPKR